MIQRTHICCIKKFYRGFLEKFQFSFKKWLKWHFLVFNLPNPLLRFCRNSQIWCVTIRTVHKKIFSQFKYANFDLQPKYWIRQNTQYFVVFKLIVGNFHLQLLWNSPHWRIIMSSIHNQSFRKIELAEEKLQH